MKRTYFPHVTNKVRLPLIPQSVIFLSAHIKHLNVSLGKTLSFPPFVIRNSWPELLSWCYDNAWNHPVIYKIGFDNRLACRFTALRPQIYHTTHITQNSSPPVRVGGGERSEGGRGRRRGDGRLSDSWKMCVAKKFIKHCRFPWHVHLLASPRGTPLQLREMCPWQSQRQLWFCHSVGKIHHGAADLAWGCEGGGVVYHSDNSRFKWGTNRLTTLTKAPQQYFRWRMGSLGSGRYISCYEPLKKKEKKNGAQSFFWLIIFFFCRFLQISLFFF